MEFIVCPGNRGKLVNMNMEISGNFVNLGRKIMEFDKQALLLTLLVRSLILHNILPI